MSKIADNDPKVAALVSECENLGIVHDCNERWERGIPHHPDAERIFELLKESDWNFGEDYFCWKSGGDGDSGETLMFALSVQLELYDARKAAPARREVSPPDSRSAIRMTCQGCGYHGAFQPSENYKGRYVCPNCTGAAPILSL